MKYLPRYKNRRTVSTKINYGTSNKEGWEIAQDAAF
jgi:hypothetical protein